MHQQKLIVPVPVPRSILPCAMLFETHKNFLPELTNQKLPPYIERKGRFWKDYELLVSDIQTLENRKCLRDPICLLINCNLCKIDQRPKIAHLYEKISSGAVFFTRLVYSFVCKSRVLRFGTQLKMDKIHHRKQYSTSS